MSEVKVPVGYKQTEVGVIPDDWGIKNIGLDSTLKARIGWQALTTNEYQQTGNYYLVTGTDFNAGEVQWDSCWYVDEWRYKQDSNIQLKTEDVLVTKDGTIGKVGYVDELPKPATLNSGVFVIRPKYNSFIPKYFFYVLTSSLFKEFIRNITAGSTITHLYQKDFVHFNFPVPSEAEQTAIANALTDTDNLIQSLEKLIAKKEAIKTGTMQQLLTGKTRLPEFATREDGSAKGFKQTELGKIPEDWEITKLGDLLFEFRNGFSFSAKGYVNSGTPIITMSQIGLNGEFKYDLNNIKYWVAKDFEKLKDFWVKDGDLLIAMTDVTPDKNLIGQMTIAKLPHTALLNQRVGILRVKDNKACPNYIRYLSNLPLWRNYCKGVASLGVQANIGTNDIKKGIIAIPELPEQNAIATILSDMDAEIEALQDRLEKTKAIKQGMMQQLLTGKVRLV